MRVVRAVVMPRVMRAVRTRHALHVAVVFWRGLMLVPGRIVLRGGALRRDGRKRLNRKAQRQQDDDEEFAPVRHGSGNRVCQDKTWAAA